MFKGVRNDAGRPLGAINKSTRLVKETIASILEDNLELFKERLLELNSKEFVKAYMDLTKYVIPTLKAVEIDDTKVSDIPAWIDNYNEKQLKEAMNLTKNK